MKNKSGKTRKVDSDRRLLAKNTKVSESVVVRYLELEKKLKELGVDTEPHYTLSPPLGGYISNFSKK